ncbi:PWI domain-containing protein [Aspergillus lucknowensis]|uniref:PWI domain-containing protein n=1 Tax=Aspergillus lucknowensis TaxID=176173 RepID=A0ABR4LRG1_9EURO
MATRVDAKLLRQTKFPPEFNQKVDMTKVNIEVMKKWIAGKISEILGNEDDVVIELCFNLLEGSRFPDIKSLQIQLTGFLDKDTARFCKELWSLCLSGQQNPQGVPKELLEAKKLELIQEKIEAEKAAAEARRKKEQEQAQEGEEADLEDETLIAGHHQDGVAPTVTGTSPPGESSIRMSPPDLAEAVRLLDHPVAHPLARDPYHLLDRHRTGNATTATDVVDHPAALFRRTEEAAGGKGDAVPITVIELDPSPAVIHLAHVLPEEIDDAGPLLPAARPARRHVEINAEGIPPVRDHGRDR